MMQIQADLLQAAVIRPKVTETTALGAAFLAGLASGFWPSLDTLKNLWEEERCFKPSTESTTQQIISLWEERVARILTPQ